MAWRVAKSLEVLRTQINELFPNRSKKDDGTIGDERHQTTDSDHNPHIREGQMGVVSALDITHDPAHGVDTYVLADVLRQKRDPRIKYVISNKRIFSSKMQPWVWRSYNGVNAHKQHVHISVVADKTLYDKPTIWDLGDFGKKKIDTSMQDTPGTSRRVFLGIMATIFSDTTVAYTDVAPGWNNRPGCALPARFPLNKPRPKVKVTNPRTGKSVVCEIMDVGPWNTNDPWWETGHRPQAESGRDLGGRNTNKAGIDLTPAAAKAIGHNGLEKVDVEFV